MFVFLNAFRSISRAKGRNILIGIIVLAIAVSACVALSIKESALKAREDALSKMTITAKIQEDMESKFSAGGAQANGQMPPWDQDSMREMMQSGNALTLTEYNHYATAESVKSSYYSLSATLDASGELEPIDTMGTFEPPSFDESELREMPEGFEGFDGNFNFEFKGKRGEQGDFKIVGYSSDAAMTDFINKISTVSEGTMFTQNTTERVCIISKELATFNNLTVGNSITLANPNNAEQTYTFKIVGIYTGGEDTGSGFSTSESSANKIMTSYEALKAICDESEADAQTVTDENTGMTSTTAVQGQLDYTYIFADIESYNKFAEEAKTLGLSDDYKIVSSDVTEFEESLEPLGNLSETATTFLLVVFIIGAIVLIVINVFNIRERKYEIGVLTAIGMKKWKVASQFVIELFVISLAAIIVGAGIGAAVSVPVTNKLLQANIEASQQADEDTADSFKREADVPQGGKQMMPPNFQGGGNDFPQQPSGNRGFGKIVDDTKDSVKNVISEVSYATDLTVIIQLMGVGILLTIVSSLSAVLFVMRYEPLKILTNRD